MSHIQCGRNVLRQLVKNSTLHSFGSITNQSIFVGQGLRYRKLEVILTTSIEKLGKAGETVKVAPGYFRNHLMPKLLAVPNIEKYAYLIKEQRQLHQPEEVETVKVVPQTKEDKMKEYQTAAKRLDNANLVLRRLIRVKNKDPSSSVIQLQSPITKEELVSEVGRQLCVSLAPENLYLPESLSAVGTYEVPLLLPKSIPLPEGKLRWSLDVKVRPK